MDFIDEPLKTTERMLMIVWLVLTIVQMLHGL